jgi:hypothetical protein
MQNKTLIDYYTRIIALQAEVISAAQSRNLARMSQASYALQELQKNTPDTWGTARKEKLKSIKALIENDLDQLKQHLKDYLEA